MSTWNADVLPVILPNAFHFLQKKASLSHNNPCWWNSAFHVPVKSYSNVIFWDSNCLLFHLYLASLGHLRESELNFVPIAGAVCLFASKLFTMKITEVLLPEASATDFGFQSSGFCGSLFPWEIDPHCNNKTFFAINAIIW